ncbi:glycoside hydrolase family 88/105 protein [Paenibacillus arenilitoris]|uniref:Glycoside hydrolase family 88 protein n=1 Tax=Paenibacillus arenilitoris TaxID=2772299 RepID=A0A927CI02_9BACL|nr:glycoside hydrolase family 88 protein [Paenibacillus arenilitoris]MBD2866978.1 glycoside hydrolase family 88 protein [Paenibacillus arenilitoris]
MTTLFPKHRSAAVRLGHDDIDGVIRLIAGKYMGDHPPLPYVYRAFRTGGVRQEADGRFDLNLRERLPGSEYGQSAFALGLVWSDEKRWIELAVSCYGPMKLWVNRMPVYKSGIAEEVNREVVKTFGVELEEGWNELCLQLRDAPSGFGCLIGSARSKWVPLDVLSPFREREGEAGWVYSEPGRESWRDAGKALPDALEAEAVSGLIWHPREAASSDGGTGAFTLWWSKLRQPYARAVDVRFKGDAAGTASLYVDGKLVREGFGRALEADLRLDYGDHDVVLIADAPVTLGASCAAGDDGSPSGLSFACPHPVHGFAGAWLTLGGFDEPPADIAREGPAIAKLYANRGDSRYWRTDDGAAVRPYIANKLFGRWTYPLGVTLYGLLRAGEHLKREDISAYAASHLQACVDTYAYSRWDGETQGYPSVNHQLVEMAMLDDCGSCGSAMLEAAKRSLVGGWEQAAEDIADYMLRRQERKPDGAYYRRQIGYFMENTMWADDLYMSVPFLIRYAELAGQPEGLDEAARQFLLFRDYLYMPAKRLMSHVYDFKYGTPTYVPWGRGNGWVLFSLSELLEALPRRHAAHGELLGFFRELSAGVLDVQGASGLWHQVLDEPDAYEETSCTAMFVYAYARGLRLGLLPEKQGYERAAERGWRALAERSIDESGNVHGVCVGSRYAFSSDYYKNELPWATNDTHGIGIVMLAGVEIAKLRESYANKASEGEGEA